ncbi:MAG: hypothetical protein ACYCOU_06430, partial [Sulfobacillus sp.]
THAHPSGMHRARSAALRTPTQAACIGRDPPPYARPPKRQVLTVFYGFGWSNRIRTACGVHRHCSTSRRGLRFEPSIS